MRRSGRLLCLLVAIGPLAAAQDQAPASVGGRVLDALTGAPLSKTTVFLRPVEGEDLVYRSSTLADGRFLFPSVPPGRYRLIANRTGYVGAAYISPDPPRTNVLVLWPDDSVREIVLKLLPHAAISGVVIDEDGDPVEGAEVQAYRYGYRDGRRQLVATGTAARANDLGEYRVSGLRPGRYYIGASMPQHHRLERRIEVPPPGANPHLPEQGYEPVYYPDAGDPAGAVPINLSAGREVHGVDLMLRRTNVYRVSGRVVGIPDGSARQRVTVVLAKEDGTVAATVESQAGTGEFEFRGVRPGSFVLFASGESGEWPFYARRPIALGEGNLTGLELALTPAIEAGGYIEIEPPAPAFDPRSIRVRFIPEQPLNFNPDTRVREDRSFSSLLAPLRYRIAADGLPPGYYLRAVRFRQIDILETGLDVTAGVFDGELILEIRAGAGIVSGTVLDPRGGAAAGVKVSLAQEGLRAEWAELYHVTETDTAGMYQFRDLPPGDYRLYAWEELEEGAHMDQDLLERHRAEGVAVRIRENSVEPVQLKLIPAQR